MTSSSPNQPVTSNGKPRRSEAGETGEPAAGAPDSTTPPVSGQHPSPEVQQFDSTGGGAGGHATWVPDPMELAQFAAQMYPEGSRRHDSQGALQQAWAAFVHSKVFCAELQKMSVEQLCLLYAGTPGIVHSSSVAQAIRKSGPPEKVLAFYPSGPKTDPVREYLKVKSHKSVVEKIMKYCPVSDEGENGPDYREILKEAERGAPGEERYYEFTVTFLDELKRQRTADKVTGGRKSQQAEGKLPRERSRRRKSWAPLETRVPDDLNW